MGSEEQPLDVNETVKGLVSLMNQMIEKGEITAESVRDEGITQQIRIDPDGNRTYLLRAGKGEAESLYVLSLFERSAHLVKGHDEIWVVPSDNGIMAKVEVKEHALEDEFMHRIYDYANRPRARKPKPKEYF